METGVARSGDCTRKRKSSESTTNVDSIDFKRQRWYYILESDHRDVSDSGAESIYSYQEKSTDIVTDTSDTSTSSDSGDMREVEYEVASMSEAEVVAFQASILGLDDDSTGPQGIVTNVGVIMNSGSEDMVVMAGEEVRSSGADSCGSESASISTKTAVIKNDKTVCCYCQKPKAYAALPFCLDCYRAKKDLHPPRPRGRKRNKSGESSQTSVQTNSTTVASQGTSSSSTIADDQEIVIGKCQVCFNLPADSGFVHSKIAHVYACYDCSRRMWKERARCPICNIRIYKVVKLIF